MKIQITSPCSENWEKMKIGVISRHCDKCDKPVMNFTKMNRAEIITYLLSNPNEEVCGSMNRDQFDFHHEDIPILIDALEKKGGNISFLILALVCLSLVACQEDNRTTSIKTPNPIHQSTNSKATIENGDKSNDTFNIKNGKKVDHSKTDPSGQNWIEPDPILGEVVLPEPPTFDGGIGIVNAPDIVNANGDDEILTFAEKMPEFPGGMNSLFTFIKTNLKYPEFERENGIAGTVYVKFVVTKEGIVKSPEILRGVNGAPNFNREVLRVVNLMPQWIPGENGGKKVNVYFTIPVKFRLD